MTEGSFRSTFKSRPFFSCTRPDSAHENSQTEIGEVGEVGKDESQNQIGG